MTPDSGAPNPRFRAATVVSATPQDRLGQLLDDGERFWELYQEQLATAGRAGDWDGVLELAAVGRRVSDPHRAYAAQRLAASVLLGAAAHVPHGDDWAWVAPYDAVVALLVPVLEQNPHEPALLDQLGVAVYELGHTTLARRLFEAVRELEPEDEQARAHLRACRERLAAAVRPPAVAEERTPALRSSRAHVKRIAERATRLEARTISLCMIVKDEEELLPGCLAAAAPHVDEIIVVDTGSSDRTREIATEFGATVVEFPWNGSFSDARNESLRHATSDWILWLDADEHLVDDDGARLHEYARRTWVEGWHVVETHFMGSGEESDGSAQHAPMRMFRRRPGYEWRGTVHEQVLWALPTWLPDRVRHTDVRVNHYGYTSSLVADRDKHERNLSLLMTQVASERTAFTCFNIGTEHAAMGEWLEARRWFEEALALARQQEGWQQAQFAPLMVQRTLTARRQTGDEAGSIALATEGLALWPDYTDLAYERALAHRSRGDLDAAAADARLALELGDAPARFVAVSGKGSFQARTLLAGILRLTNDPAGARAQLERVVEEFPQYVTAVEELTELLLAPEDADPVAVSATIDELLGERAAAATPNLRVGAVFHEAGHFALAEERYDRVLAARSDHPGALVARSELRLAQGRIREAWDDGMAVAELHPVAPRGAMSAFLAAAALDEPALLEAPAARITAADSLPAAERAVYAAWRAMLDPAHAGIATLVPQDPLAVEALLRNLQALIRLEATDAFERLYPLAQQVLPDERRRRMALADLYLRACFADMAGEELMICAERFGPDAAILTGLGKVATMKGMWEDAEVFLAESLAIDPGQLDARRLLAAVQERVAG